MKTYAITHAYADWCCDQQADLYFVLNHANSTFSKPLSYEVLSSQVRRLFYQLECEYSEKIAELDQLENITHLLV